MSSAEHAEGLLEQIVHGRGFPEETALTNPAAGVDLTYKLQGRYWERLLALTCTLVTDATAGNRSVILQVLDADDRVLAAIPPAAVQTATLTRVYTWLSTVSVPSGPFGGFYLAPAPFFFLMPTWKVRVHVDTVKAGDQISAATLYRERFETGPGGYPMGGGWRLERGELVDKTE